MALQLLQTLDSGQAVDISGLPNKRLVVLLQGLFQSLNLKKSTGGAFLLPSRARPILERLSWPSISINRPIAGTSGEAREHGSESLTPASSMGRNGSDHKSLDKLDETAGPLPRPPENTDAPKRR